MTIIKRVWQDIRSGDNLDLYITLVTSAVLTIINLVGIRVAQDSTLPLILGVLTLLTVNHIATRYRLEKIDCQLSSRTNEDLFMESFPDEFQQEIKARMKQANEILIIGSSLQPTLRRNFQDFDQFCQRGGKLKVLITDPNSPACAMVARADFPPISEEDERNKINMSIKSFSCMKGGNKVIRLIDYPAGFGGIFFNPNEKDKKDTAFYIWHHSFKVPRTNQPKMVLRPKNGCWFDLYKDEIEMMWNDARPMESHPE